MCELLRYQTRRPRTPQRAPERATHRIQARQLQTPLVPSPAEAHRKRGLPLSLVQVSARLPRVWNSDIDVLHTASTSLRDNLSPPPLSNAALSALKSSRSQLNSLINKLGAGPYRGGGGSDNLKPSNLSYRLSKAKRDAEEADAAYRSALHHLETLRMQRERVSKASMGSLQEFAFEFSTTCKSELGRHSYDASRA